MGEEEDKAAQRLRAGVRRLARVYFMLDSLLIAVCLM